MDGYTETLNTERRWDDGLQAFSEDLGTSMGVRSGCSIPVFFFGSLSTFRLRDDGRKINYIYRNGTFALSFSTCVGTEVRNQAAGGTSENR